MKSEYRPGGKKYDVAHRVWLQPDDSLEIDTRKSYCHKCLRHKNHPVHRKYYRDKKDWFGWKNHKDIELWKRNGN